MYIIIGISLFIFFTIGILFYYFWYRKPKVIKPVSYTLSIKTKRLDKDDQENEDLTNEYKIENFTISFNILNLNTILNSFEIDLKEFIDINDFEFYNKLSLNLETIQLLLRQTERKGLELNKYDLIDLQIKETGDLFSYNNEDKSLISIYITKGSLKDDLTLETINQVLPLQIVYTFYTFHGLYQLIFELNIES